MSDPAIINAILRCYYSSSNFNRLNPPAAAPVEIDHFFEVQHIIDLLFVAPAALDPGSWYGVPVGQFVDLATFVGDHRNLFQITKAQNQAKKLIPLNQYAPAAHNHTIQTYLAEHITTTSGTVTVGQTLQAMAVEMRARNTPMGALTRNVGTKLCALMGW